MLRKLLETRTGPLTDREFREVMNLVTLDIQVNRIDYGQRTSLTYAVQVATITHALTRKINIPLWAGLKQGVARIQGAIHMADVG